MTARLDADVAVVGLGAMGAMSAWHLARSGARVLGFEQFGIAHDRGAAGGESRLFRMAYHEGPEYVPLLRRARELWRELAEASGRDLFIPTGCLSIGLPDIPPMVNVRRSVTDHGLEHEILAADELVARYPQHALHDGEIGILDVAGGMLRPELAVLAAAEQARASGARLHDHTPVRAIEPGDGAPSRSAASCARCPSPARPARRGGASRRTAAGRGGAARTRRRRCSRSAGTRVARRPGRASTPAPARGR